MSINLTRPHLLGDHSEEEQPNTAKDNSQNHNNKSSSSAPSSLLDPTAMSSVPMQLFQMLANNLQRTPLTGNDSQDSSQHSASRPTNSSNTSESAAMPFGQHHGVLGSMSREQQVQLYQILRLNLESDNNQQPPGGDSISPPLNQGDLDNSKQHQTDKATRGEQNVILGPA